jgi:hypothetical protein
MSADDAILKYLGEDLLRELLKPPPVPRFAAETVPPPARRS